MKAILLSMLLGAPAIAGADEEGVAMRAVPFTNVRLTDDFWAPRFETNRRVTVPYCFEKCEQTGRIGNFARAGGLAAGDFEGIYFNDSDVFKVIEGAAYALAAHPDPELDAALDEVIAKIAAAQEPDGYLSTYHTLVAPDRKWTDIRNKHELYCAGHLFEAAVAHHMATGKRSLLDVAIRLADHVDAVFGPDGRHDPPGHQEIEIGLVKLYQLTGERRYLDLAKFFIDQRGRADRHELYGPYAQDHVPVVEQDVPVGHAVRAMYLYCGMADVAAETGDRGYLDALDGLWQSMVQRKLAITGGVGARQHGEAFGDDWELPNASAYNETCAAIGNALWNHRMNLLHGDARYVDVLERVIYNGFLAGVSLQGDRFFYPNPLASLGSYHRSPWFSCSCCPVNVVRFVPSIAGYVYARQEDAIAINLFVQSEADVELPANRVSLRQTTRYPWEGRVEVDVHPERNAPFTLRIRIPGWARGAPVPSGLYAYADTDSTQPPRLAVNGATVEPAIERGYAVLHRTWRAGDRVTLDLPMPVRRVRADERVEEDRDRVAIERGPIVFCVEAVDHGGRVRNLWLPPDAPLRAEHRSDVLGGVTVVTGTARARRRAEDGRIVDEPAAMTAIPYYAWDHRDAGEMQVWLAARAARAEVLPPPTLASSSRVSASHCFQLDTVQALNDQVEPQRSDDHSIPRFTWWDHRGTTEWAQYEFDEPRWVSSAEVYWFDDTGVGQCRLPASWRLLYRDDDRWRPVAGIAGYPVEKDGYTRVSFDPTQTTAIRLEVQLQEGFSGGLLEWRVD
jgi:DUF1680 family protein